MASTEPDLTVGIDFGMTCTGVAFAKRGLDSPRMVQEWPLPQRKRGTHNKVPSTLLYGEHHAVKEWGFTCQNHDGTIEWFKRYLEEKSLNNLHDACKKRGVEPPFKSLKDVRKIYGDYMKCLYQHISKYFQKNDPWKDKSVEFIFSLPATFRSLEVSNALMEQIKKAGFGSGGKRHHVSWGLTEPQASAVYTALEANVTFRKDDIILVCDAGGGTTDLALLQQNREDGLIDLRELAIIQGNNIGSTNIDLAFKKLVEGRLAKSTRLNFKKNAAATMMHSDEFQTWKHEFGSIEESQFGTARVTVPIASGGNASTNAGISDGKMNISHNDLRSLFDPEVDGMISSIRHMIDVVTKNDPSKEPNWLVLSGGLGSSAYVKQRVRAAFPSPRVVIADEDEPAKSGKSALRFRKARASYGVITEERYDKRLEAHAGKHPVISKIDGCEMVENRVVWVIKKGDDIDTDANDKKKGFSKVTNTLDGPIVSKRTLVICHKSKDELPHDADDVDVIPLCVVESVLDKKHARWRHVKKSGFRNLFKAAGGFWEIEYEVRFVVGAIDARFELWIGNREKVGHAESYKALLHDDMAQTLGISSQIPKVPTRFPSPRRDSAARSAGGQSLAAIQIDSFVGRACYPSYHWGVLWGVTPKIHIRHSVELMCRVFPAGFPQKIQNCMVSGLVLDTCHINSLNVCHLTLQ
ncbi:uncharacterized protein E0L32_006124 [Thyridium curvatum]|uniref:Uncharacterized protein n=1 Tax=Thyridium curvatum TaxID=1093900 RepID=A0A507B3U1_9PEZI|nr:uncharacterized protein E0L32_006124 [Thyridium curvatum]TPX13394.1 hypothetical protein E0L32_006124 [Thyridium curvatum]